MLAAPCPPSPTPSSVASDGDVPPAIAEIVRQFSALQAERVETYTLFEE